MTEFKVKALFPGRKEVSETEWLTGDEFMTLVQGATNGEWMTGNVTIVDVKLRNRREK